PEVAPRRALAAARVVRDVARADPARRVERPRARPLDLAPERLLVEEVALCDAGQLVARLGAQHPARAARARERAVDAAERLDPDEVAQHEQVERHLQPALVVDLARGVRALPRLVVLHDPAGAERVDVDAVDLPREEDAVAELEPALELRRRAVAPEADLEAAGLEHELRARLLAHEPLEVAPERLAQLRRRDLAELEPHARAERVVEAALEERQRPLEVLGRRPVGAELLRQAAVERVER